ncbi:sensor histidine kinase [Alkaliphilus sp. MSJ-5]|uniref:Sensor histidine kinase n=1 Tax=Alkaliphilus flagellatus TaxID=2841507 RepID=A0ABS6G491_9FIRM|nr:ATP-binding protein [Alkaliphilus flagellatus]MBU5676961.1 sensor histidine kinase [Alkaliphilus flagellatus]
MNDEKKYKLVIILLLILITGLHYSTQSSLWGIHDFYRRLYYLPIILGAFKFRLRGGFIISTLVVLIYAPHLLIYFGEINIEVINQFLESGMFMVVGLITGYLVEQDYKRGKALEYQVVKIANLENYTHNILESIDSGVIAFESEGQLGTVNRRIERILGKQEEVKRFISQEGIVEEINKVLLGKEKIIKRGLSYVKDKDEEIYIEMTIHPIENMSKVREGAVVVVQDKTTVKKLEDQVRRGERLAAVGQLASGIAHEIRNPLGIIKTISQTINQDVRDEDLKEGLDIIKYEIDRANKVIQGLLDFAKPNKIQDCRIDLGKLLEELVLVTRKFGKQQNVELILNRMKESKIEGDPDKLKQAFVNIILNGIQAMKNGGKLEITLGNSEGKWIIISFKDEGEGILEEVFDQIFNPFFTTKESGTGLGLSITHRIIEEHNGKIEFNSKLWEGTEMKVYLPLLEKEATYV